MRTPSRSCWLPVLTAIIIVSGAGTAGAQTFTFNVPDRFPNLPVAAVRITLDMSGDPTGSTLLLGSTTLSLNALAQPVTTSFGTDLVIFRRLGMTNRLEILMALESNMEVVGEHCVKKAAAVFPQQRSTTLTPPAGVTVTSHRLTGYTTLSTFECKCASRRIGTTPVTWLTPPPGTSAGRHPLDVILVLDRSGSMGSAPMGGSGSKMSILKWAVGQFIDTWKLEASGVPDDRIAVVWFETGVKVGSNFVARSVAGGWDGIKAGVNSEVIAGATALGDGVTKAIDMWVDDAAHNDPTIVLMTNGMQNSGNQIRPGNQVGLPSPDLACFDANSNTYQVLHGQCVPIQTIGVGAPATQMHNLLNKIAEQTGGTTGINLGNTMDFAFLTSLVNVLKGNTMSVLGQFAETMAATAVAAAPRVFELDGSVRQALAVLSWRNREARFDLRITAPGGALVNPTTRVDEALYTIQTVALPASGPPGQWSATVARQHQAGREEPYHLSLYTVEGRLQYAVRFGKGNQRAGEPIDLQVEISQDGKPVTALGSAITIRVAGPKAALGKALHDQSVPGGVLTADPPGLNTEGSSAGAPYQRKVHQLLTTTKLLADITPVDLQVLTLRDDGKAPDVRADDGIYTATFANTGIPGHYIFDASVDFSSGPTGQIRRAERLEALTSIKADPATTPITVSGAPGTTRTFEIEPRDAAGNFLGPGFADFLRVAVQGGGTVASVSDPQETGRYVVTVTGVPANTDPNVLIAVDGEQVYSGPVSGAGRPRTPTKPTLLLVILLLLLLLAVAIYLWKFA